MSTDRKLMDMLVGYAASHQHPFNVFVHMIGIPTIMFGLLVPLTWVRIDLPFVSMSLAHVLLIAFVGFYLTLDIVFALVFAVIGALLTAVALEVGQQLPLGIAGPVAAACFLGGYLLQFVGHAVEKSMPVLVRHPIQAQLAAPFFAVVELFKLLRLREGLFDEVQRQLVARRDRESIAG